MLKGSPARRRGFRLALTLEPLEDRCLLANSFLQGVAYHDLNENNRLDPTDPRQGGALVELFRGNEQNPLATAVTDNDGYYLFLDVVPGNYRVVETPPEGFANFGAQANSQIDPATVPAGSRNTIQVTVLDPATLSSAFQGLYSFRTLPANSVTLFGQVPNGFFNMPGDVGQTQVRITRPGLPSVDIRTWCAELAVSVEFPGGRFAPLPLHGTTERGLQIGYLFNRYGMRDDLTPDQAAGLQMAFWEMLYDTPSNDPFNTGNFRYVIPNPDVVREANFYLNDAVGRTGYAVYQVSADPLRQAFLSAQSLDFGSVRPALITGWHWNDRSGDGIWDAAEPGVAGAIVEALRNGQVVATSRTMVDDPSTPNFNETGLYWFGLVPGTYTLRLIPQPGIRLTYPGAPGTHTITLTADQFYYSEFGEAMPLNFGCQSLSQPAMIDAWKWEDRNGNSRWDQGEPGLPGWTIEALQNGQVVARTVTMRDDPATPDFDETGLYWLELAPGTYVLREVAMPGWRQTYPGGNGTHTITLRPGEQFYAPFGQAVPTNFGNQRLSGLSGWKWNDRNFNSRWDQGEPGLGDWTLFLDLNNNARLDPGERSTTTSANGQYRFDNLVPGTHRVCEVVQFSWTPTYPMMPPPCHTVTLASGQMVAGRFETAEPPNFGNFQGAMIDAWKWHDVNGNSRWDVGEQGLAGFLVEAVQNGQVVARTVTMDDDPTTPEFDETGIYWLFVPPGTTVLREVLPPGWRQTYPGGNGTHTITLAAGENFQAPYGVAAPTNFGNQQVAMIGGWKWNDLNGDGRWDANEPGLPWWDIELVQNNVVVARTFTIDDDPSTPEFNERGSYFIEVPAGTYTIREVLQEHWRQTYPGNNGGHTVTLAAGQLLDGQRGVAQPPNFGNQLLVMIDAWKWHDRDGNGQWDVGEPGLAGWTIELLLNNVVIARTVTMRDDPATPDLDETGLYWLDAPPGTYQVREVLQAGWIQTYPPNNGTHTVILRPGEDVYGSFGVTEPPNFGNCSPAIDECASGPRPGRGGVGSNLALLTWLLEEVSKQTPALQGPAREALAEVAMARLLVEEFRARPAEQVDQMATSATAPPRLVADDVFARADWLGRGMW